jgi:ABC-type transport system involved in cytochrome bd biosynthesis fused ATPase/permease subunit
MLMAGLARPDGGSIRYAEQDISRLDDHALSKRRGWLNQNSVIFDRSLRENLTLGREGFDDASLTRLLELCGLGHLDSELEHGLQTRLGNDGARLSGGQARRIALARTLLEPRPVLLLDEPSEHLDPDSEEALWTAIEQIGRQRPMTVVAVSHRPRARQWAHRIVDLGPVDKAPGGEQ